MDDIRIDDSKSLSPEELAKYTWTDEDQRKMTKIIDEAFEKYKRSEDNDD